MGVGDELDLRQVSANISLSYGSFTEFYDRLAAENGSDSLRLLNQFSNPSADREQAYVHALEAAREKGWLQLLLRQLGNANGLRSEIFQADNSISVQLQGIISPSAGFLLAGALGANVLRAVPRVCKITVNRGSVITGTGFLIGPQVVLTAWHVIRSLFKKEEPTVPHDDSAQCLQIEFEHSTGDKNEQIKVAPQWLLASSPAHALELEGTLDYDPQRSIDGFDSHLDFALIQLERPVGIERGFYSLRPDVLAAEESQITLFHHPGNSALCMSNGQLIGYWPAQVKTRLMHAANTLRGSSGGLVLNERGEAVALHQSAWKDAVDGNTVNGAVPIRSIAAACAASNVDVNVTSGFVPLALLSDKQTPVIGRRKFQQYLTDAIVGRTKIIAVRGQEKSGRTFSVQIMQTLLATGEDAVLHLSVKPALPDPWQIANWLLASFQDDTMQPANLPVASASNTTPSTWLKEQLIPSVLDALEARADARRLWLVLDDLNGMQSGSEWSRFLSELLPQAGKREALRVVLLGNDFTFALPAGTALDQLEYPTTTEVQATIDGHKVLIGFKGDLNSQSIANMLCPPPTVAFSQPITVVAQRYIDMLSPHLVCEDA